MFREAGRGGGIRTPDLLVPNQTRCQTALRPDIKVCYPSIYIILMQAGFFMFSQAEERGTGKNSQAHILIASRSPLCSARLTYKNTVIYSLKRCRIRGAWQAPAEMIEDRFYLDYSLPGLR